MWNAMYEEREWMRDDFQRDDSNKLQKAYDQGYEDGYRKGYNDCMDSLEYDSRYDTALDYGDGGLNSFHCTGHCTTCRYYDDINGTCVDL